MTDSRGRYRNLDDMTARHLSASRLPRSTSRSSTHSSRKSSTPSGREKPLPITPIAVFEPASSGPINTTLHDESRPLSPSSAASFSRVRKISGIPIAIRTGTLLPLSRTEPYHHAFSRLSVGPSTPTPSPYIVADEELSGLGIVNLSAREGRENRRKAGYYQARLVDIPPSRSKINQDQFSSSPPTTNEHTSPLPTIPSDDVLPGIDFDNLQPASPHSASNSMTAMTPAATPESHPPRSESRAPLLTEAGDGSPLNKGLVRHDSPMHPAKRAAVTGAVFTNHVGEEEGHKSEGEPEADDHVEALPWFPTTMSRPMAPPPTPLGVPHANAFSGLAGVNTPGKMRAAAARTVIQQDEPNFARGTASFAAKSSVPPDISRMNARGPLKISQLPVKRRGVFGRLGGLFHKGQKKDRDEYSPVRMRVGRDEANNKHMVKRQSILTGMEFPSTPSLSEAILPPLAFSVRRSASPTIPADGSGDSTTALCKELLALASSEDDERRRNKLSLLSQSLLSGQKNVHSAESFAATAQHAAERAEKCMDFSRKLMIAMQKKAVREVFK